MTSSFPDKTCARCGRYFSWRKKWARTWADVLYCSASCRRSKLNDADRVLEQRILRGITIGPKEGILLESLHRESEEAEPLRQAARRLAIEGKIVMRQNGRPIDPRELHGPVKVSLP